MAGIVPCASVLPPVGNGAERRVGFGMQSTGVVVVVGSTMIDMIAYVDRAPDAGETVVGAQFLTGFGGKGANQAVCARRFGATVHMVNTVGTDGFGDETIANFEREGIDTAHIARAGGASGVAPIWVEADGTNRIIVIPGANHAMTAAQAVAAIDAIDDVAVVVGQLEIPQEVTAAAFERARQRGAVTLLNPAPYAPISQRLLAAADWLLPNEVEFAGLHPAGAAPTDDTIAQLPTGAQVLVTLGAAGAAVRDANGAVWRVPAPEVTATDTTGAGDCFVGAFAYGLATGLPVRTAVELGVQAASLSVTRPGTQSSYPTPDEAAALLRQLTQ